MRAVVEALDIRLIRVVGALIIIIMSKLITASDMLILLSLSLFHSTLCLQFIMK